MSNRPSSERIVFGYEAELYQSQVTYVLRLVHNLARDISRDYVRDNHNPVSSHSVPIALAL